MKRNAKKSTVKKSKATTKKAENTQEAAPVKEPSKEMTAFFGGTGIATDMASVAQSMAKVGAMSRNVGSGLFLKFNKQGEWLFGADEDEVESEDFFAVNPLSFTNGFIGWRSGSVVGEHMCPVTQGMPCTEAELDPIESSKQGDGWNAQLGLTMRSMDADEPLELIYNTSSRGGKQSISKLAEEISQRIVDAPEACVPVVSLLADSYKHKQYGTIYTPVLAVIAWADMNGVIVEEVEEAIEE
jgi:hypothetical protein